MQTQPNASCDCACDCACDSVRHSNFHCDCDCDCDCMSAGELIGEKPWDMRGEIKSLERPENSLLEITAQVER
jgi:hypothetical protein